MPFLFKTHYEVSSKHGTGIYASQDIPAGAIYWTLMSHANQIAVEGTQLRQNEIYTQKQFQKIIDEDKKLELVSHGFFFSKGQVLIGLFDGCYYFNHDPNGPSYTIFNGNVSELHSIMTRDVKKGEQLSQNYSHWAVSQCQWLEQLMKNHFPVRYKFEKEYIEPLLKQEQEEQLVEGQKLI